MNLADIEYFKFASSRSNFSTLTMLTYGNDLQQQLPSFFKDYWYIFIFQCLFFLLGWFLYKRINNIEDDSSNTSWIKQIVIFIISTGTIVLIGRGTGLRPIEPINITAYTIEQNVPLVLNSSFTIIKSWGKTNLEEKEYFVEKELTNIFNPVKQYDNSAELDQPNIVLIILESFSVEYIASINKSKDIQTPFLDSLIGESLVYTNCYANGKKSLDAVPSILSSVPKLMEQEFITSNYSTNKIESIPKHLNKLGYQTSFFHGASNGSMNFDQFAAKVKFDNYYGRTEYNNERDFDGTWGIFDEDFFVWSAKTMSEYKKPFFSTIFSISSHPPYAIPNKHKNKFKGKTKVLNAVNYTDYALEQFMYYARSQEWYKNTLFIITADHTPSSTKPEYLKEIGDMHIPLVLFHPNNPKFKGVSTKVVGQVDIMPTIFDLIGYSDPFYSFGNSIFSDDLNYSMSLIGTKYLIFGNQFLMTYRDGKALGLYKLTNKLQDPNEISSFPMIELQLTNQIKAFIQTYHKDLIYNEMIVD